MTRQRRTHIFILALVPAVVFAAVRCADSVPTSPAPEISALLPEASSARLARLHDETDWVGRFHNDALGYVLAGVRKLSGKGRDRGTVCETARKSFAEFFKSRRNSSVPSSVDADFQRFCAGGGAGPSHFVAVGAPGGLKRSELSAGAQSLMDQIAGSIDPSTSYGDLASRVNSIEGVAAGTLSYDEAAAVMTVGSVTLNSATYWANNVTAWVPYTNGADYTRLLATRSVPLGAETLPALSNGDDGGGWSSWASQVWNDTKAAAKRAAFGDAKSAIKAVIAGGIAEGPVLFDIVLASSATGSIIAVLQL